MAAPFTAETLRFLKGLNRHNDREWFEERRPIYERELKEPLLALIAGVNEQMADFAPEYVRPPHKIAMRIYRDIRFSPDKRPYKRHISAWWARAGLEKRSAAGFYLQIGPLESFFAAGVYAPERDDLLKLRRWMAEHHERYREALKPLLRGTKASPAMKPIAENALSRNPKGFPVEHPASDLLRARNWGMHWTFPPEEALENAFTGRLVRSVQRCVPLVSLLNEPLMSTTARNRLADFAF